MKNRHARDRACLSGDGGNRTRVRKIQPSKIYERSRLRLVAADRSTSKIDQQPAARVQGPFFRAPSGVMRGTLPIVSPDPAPEQSTGQVDAISLGDRPICSTLMQRGALRRRKCFWHLIFCAEFTSSAPLGSHSGTSLSRRNRSSPISGDTSLTARPVLQDDYNIIKHDILYLK